MNAPSCDNEGLQDHLHASTAREAASQRRLAAEFLRYFGASVLALGTDLCLYAICLSIGMGWAVAAALGFCCGLGVAYVLSIRFVFEHRSITDRRLEFTIFAVVGAMGLGLTELSLWIMIEGQQFDALIAKVVTAGGVFAFNFTARKLILFRSRESFNPYSSCLDG